MLTSPFLDTEGEYFAALEQSIEESGYYQLDRYKLELFQDFLDHLEQIDDIITTDFLSCLHKVFRYCPATIGLLELDNLRQNLDSLNWWDKELAQEILAMKVEGADLVATVAA